MSRIKHSVWGEVGHIGNDVSHADSARSYGRHFVTIPSEHFFGSMLVFDRIPDSGNTFLAALFGLIALVLPTASCGNPPVLGTTEGTTKVARARVEDHQSQAFSASMSEATTPMNRTQLNSPIPPESWFWSHDIRPDTVGNLMMPGMQLMRLSAYGEEEDLRFASWSYRQGCTDASSYIIDRSANDLQNELARSVGHPVGLTIHRDAGRNKFSLVLQRCGISVASLVTGLSPTDLLDLGRQGQKQPRDIVTYIENGVRRYAALLEEATSPFVILVDADASEVEQAVKKAGMVMIRVRGYEVNGQRRYVTVARKMSVGSWRWLDGLTSDAVARELESGKGYPVDLDVYKDASGQVRYSLVMYRDR